MTSANAGPIRTHDDHEEPSAARLDWSSSVGNFILNFGALDMLVFTFLEKHLSAECFEGVRKLHLKDRMNRVVECMSAADFPQEDRDAFARLAEELEPVRTLRNHIAHGYLTVIIRDGEVPRYTISLPQDLDRPYDPESRNLKFSELCEALDRLAEVSDLLHRITRFGE